MLPVGSTVGLKSLKRVYLIRSPIPDKFANKSDLIASEYGRFLGQEKIIFYELFLMRFPKQFPIFALRGERGERI